MKSRLSLASCGQLSLLFAGFLSLAILWQSLGGAFQCELGGHPDEAAHYVTGLMIRDYLAAGLPGSPMIYAKDYYDHYPKVALGNWPPVFYVLQSVWTLVFSPERSSVLLLMAVLTAMLATLLFQVLRRAVGLPEAIAGAVLLVCAPLTQRHTAMVMTEIPIALFTFLAVLFWARFLEKEKAADAIGFGVLASVAILTKGSGLFLGLVPPLTLWFTGQWRLLKKPSFWAAAVVVFGLCFPWTWKFRDVARAGWMEGNPTLHFTQQALIYYPKKLAFSLGISLTLFALLGLLVKLVEARKEEGFGKWAAFGAAWLSLLIFHAVIPAGLEDRHLVAALPFALLFAMAGVKWTSQFLTGKGMPPKAAQTLVLGVVLAGFAAFTFRVPAKGYQGFAPVAAALLQPSENVKSSFLVSSDARGEGMFIVEVAVREKRPGHIVQRASKLLASSTWSGGGYQAKFKNEDGLRRFLEKSSVDWIVADFSLPAHARREHHDLLRQTLEKFPETFVLQADYPIQRDNVWTNKIVVYRVKK